MSLQYIPPIVAKGIFLKFRSNQITSLLYTLQKASYLLQNKI